MRVLEDLSQENAQWKYLDVLNECIKILITIGLGSLVGYSRIFEASSFIPQATKFVFNVALPCLVVAGLGITIDFYDNSILWNYIGAFLILRAIALVVSLLLVVGMPTKGVGDMAVYWLTFTWISTVILGVPISGAVFGNPDLGIKFGILAGVSSFIFQLPLQLFFLESHAIQQEDCLSDRDDNDRGGAIEENPKRFQANDLPLEEKDVENATCEFEEIEIADGDEEKKNSTNIQHVLPAKPSTVALTDHRNVSWLLYVKRRDIWLKIMQHIFCNPVIWAIIVGFILTLSTVGPKYLKPSSSKYVPGLGWVLATLLWLGDCVSPVSLLAMGIWMQKEWRTLFKIPVWTATLFMISKLILVPLVMVGLAKAVNLDATAGRAAVLISALPISQASFILGSRYKIGEAILSENVALGTLLILPTILLWNIVLDAFDLFPLSSNGSS